MDIEISRGDVFYADLSGAIGSEQNGNRPVIIIQNDKGNKHSPTTIIIPLTKKIHRKTNLPTHLDLKNLDCIKYDSTILAEQIRTLDKSRLKEKIGHIEDETIMSTINKRLEIALGIKDLTSL